MNNNTDVKQDIAELKERLENFEADLRQRIQVLEDKEAILDVLARYGFTFDLGRMEEWYDLFAEDGIFNVDARGNLEVIQGKENIKTHFQRVQQNMDYAAPQHLQLGVIIKVNGDTAKAIGFQVLTMNKGGPEIKPFIENTFVRTWTLERIEGKWLIKEAVSRILKDLENCRAIVPSDW